MVKPLHSDRHTRTYTHTNNDLTQDEGEPENVLRIGVCQALQYRALGRFSLFPVQQTVHTFNPVIFLRVATVDKIFRLKI